MVLEIRDPDETVQQCLEDAAELYAPGKWIRMVSGAAHDAQVIATRLPSGMLFMPSIGGISHDFSEDSEEKDIIRGCRTRAAATGGLVRLTRSAQA